MEKSVSYDPIPDGLVLSVNRQFSKTANASIHQFGTNRDAALQSLWHKAYTGTQRMKIIRCEQCARKLAEVGLRRLAIKYPRCGTINMLKTENLKTVRH